MGRNAIVIHPLDNVAVAVAAIPRGGDVVTDDASVPALEEIPASHKVALAAIETGGRVVRYGETIGRAAVAIAPGQWVHTHNLLPEED